MTKLKPWYQVVTPREDLRENRPMDASEFAVHLDHIRERRGDVSPDYLDPQRFFARTYLTASLLELSSQVVRRLSGIQVATSAVFNMATQFGGGKTHSLATLYHLASHGDKSRDWQGVSRILQKAEIPQVPKANVAVFVGGEFGALSGRKGDDEPTRKTPWGEIAWQLGGEKGFAAVAEHDERGIAPAGDELRAMLPDGPVLILMDELLNYVGRARRAGIRDQFFNFTQNLSEESRARSNMVLCVSIPRSELEMSPEDERDHSSLKKLLDRVGKAIMMSAESEMAEIIRRRLFEWEGINEDAKKTIRAYAEWAVDHEQELSGISADSAAETFRACYPFHPSVLSVFERKWQSVPQFQRTRGVLRLLALWVAHVFQEQHTKVMKEPLISLGSAPFENAWFRAAMFDQLGSHQLEVPVTTDIAGRKDAHAIKLDREAPDAIKKAHLHRKVASTIFFESNGGMSESKMDAVLPEIRMGVGGPDINLVDVEHVLEGLIGTCYYLNQNGSRYRFGLAPNLNQVLVTRRGAVQGAEIAEQIKKTTQEVFQQGTKALDRRYFPERSNDVPNRPVLTLAVMGLEYLADEKDTDWLMESIVRECGTPGRTYKSAILFAVADSGDTIRDAARDLLAWEAIDDDVDTKQRLDDSQKTLLVRNLKRSRKDLTENIWRAYRHLYLLGKDNRLQKIDLGQITSSSANCLVEVYLDELKRTDELTDGVGPNKLVKYWPPALAEWSTKGVRDAFYSSPQLPRLLNPDAVKRTIADGVCQGILGYALRDGNQQPTALKFNEALSESDIEIADDTIVLRAEDARKLLEPPRLDRLEIQPAHAVIQLGQQVPFRVSGLDQYGEPFTLPQVDWTTSGGTITESGIYTAAADGTGGQFTVRANVGDYEAIAELRVNPPSQTGGQFGNGPGTTGTVTPETSKKSIRWQGEVPSQKWMNFYTKVLTRVASVPGMTVKVTFEVPAEGELAQTKTDEIKSGLKELGLDDNVSLG